MHKYTIGIVSVFIVTIVVITQQNQTLIEDKPNLNYRWNIVSGGILNIKKSVLSTNIGELNTQNPVYKLYQNKAPIDSDNGKHPQNLFKITTKRSYINSTQKITYKIKKLNLSDSPNRNNTNGIFLLSKYKNEQTYYKAGLRVDGNFIISRTLNGETQILAAKTYFLGDYDRTQTPYLINTSEEDLLKFETIETKDGVMLKLYYRDTPKRDWFTMLEVFDPTDMAIVSKGKNGIQTDFMDVEFTNYKTY
ncbi:hypothetical protein KC980_03600 [candidate division WWE3 bacterium]|uniref:Uncharacterized protein n=1 Tax=candidate division WWE3 bacterium TaxID=2053526 RepID=A0A955EFM1_UNCKA|nr:hypothetical protein [candidate division WWE3 bacterium]